VVQASSFDIRHFTGSPFYLMKKNISDYLVALFVIVCSVVLLAALTIALSGYRLKKPTRTLRINYEDVTGIKLHSEVRYAGAAAGPLFENANRLLDTLNVTGTDLKGDLGDFMPKISPLLDSLRTDAEELQKVVKGLDDIEGKAGSAIGAANNFITATDKQLQE